MSDRPLEAGDPDPLNFGAIARAISKFLRNENTEPPLTIAITGDWGTGKSSILNLVKHDLELSRFRPIWFNAWHHQSEESLLAALLEKIRSNAVPPWWSPAGWIFRFNLFWVRFRRYPIRFVVLVLVLIFSLGYLLVVPPEQLISGFEEVFEGLFGDSPEKSPEDSSKGSSKDEGKQGSLIESSPLLTAIISIVALWLNTRSRLGAIGLNPTRLLGGKRLQAQDLRARTGFRHQFATEYRDVTQALKPMTLVIIIDDLDRCRAENIMDVLEMMNFLVSSGDCYILIGIAPEQVVRSIDGVLKDVSDGRHYLEKLVNIEVPVPVLDDETRRRLLQSTVADAGSATGRKARPGSKFSVLAKVIAVPILCAFLAGGYWLGLQVQPDPGALGGDDATGIDIDVAAVEATVAAVAAIEKEIESEPVVEPSARLAPEAKAVLVQAHAGARAMWPAGLVAGILLFLVGLVAYEQMRRRQVALVRDSPAFAKALDIWYGVIGVTHPTPRSIKRFMNRLRYLAMRQRSDDTQAVDAVDVRIPETVLVALCALDAGAPEALDRLVEGGASTSWTDGLEAKALAQRISSAAATHEAELGDWPPSSQHLVRYRQLVTGIGIN